MASRQMKRTSKQIKRKLTETGAAAGASLIFLGVIHVDLFVAAAGCKDRTVIAANSLDAICQ